MFRIKTLLAVMAFTAIFGLGVSFAAIHYAGTPHMPWDSVHGE